MNGVACRGGGGEHLFELASTGLPADHPAAGNTACALTTAAPRIVGQSCPSERRIDGTIARS
jgi:hypothetical protein